jgi:sugar lactone lactonase YvrE
VAVDDSGNVFVGDSPHRDWDGGVKEIPIGCDSESCIKVLGGGIQSPGGVAVDRSGNVYVADSHDRVLKKIPPGCASAICVRSLGGGFKYPSGVAVDKSGNVFVTDPENNAVKEIPPGCISASCVKTLGSGFNYPGGIAVDRSGNVFISDAGNNRVVELENAGTEAIQIATPGSANLAPFFGIWNKVGFHGGYVKVIISGSPERPRVHLWGAGSPQDSDDGEEDAIWDGSALNATFQQDGRPTVYRFTLDQNANLQLNCHYLRRNGTEASCVTMSYTR